MTHRTMWLLVLLVLLALVHSSNVIILNRGCRQFDSAGACVACSNRFYKDKEGICQPVNNNCRTYDSSNGACTTCYDGFAIVQTVCLPQLKSNDISSLLGPLANCNQLGDNGTCKKCSIGYYFDANKLCKKIPDTCANFNVNLGRCTACYQGYGLNSNNECVISPTQTVIDAGCSKFENGKCTKCSVGYYFDSNKQCKMIPASCQYFDTNTQKCTTCYSGYDLDNLNNCVQSKPESSDPGCARFQAGKCTKCSFGFYFNRDNKCKMIPPTCSNFNTATEICQGCYTGYTLNKDKNCVQDTQAPPIDPGCSRFQNGKCVKCSFGYYFGKEGRCKIIPTTCGRFDTSRQICQACYPGFVLKDGSCIIETSTVSDPGCNSFQNGKCVKCSFGYYFDRNRVCKLIPPTCQEYDTLKQICKVCYPGYSLNQNKQCLQSVAAPVDPGCSKFENGVCTKCSIGYYFNRAKVCKLVPPTCSNFDATNQRCQGCYDGYELDFSKNCVESIKTVSDLGCNKFEFGKCVLCSNGYFFNSLGVCQQIPASCSKFDNVRAICRACYSGYELNSRNQCVASQQGVSDPNCRQFKNGKCTQCSIGAFFNSQGICVNSDPLCKNFSSTTQKCKECYPGYNLDPVQLTCFEAPASNIDPNCRKFNNNECVECSFRFFKGRDGICKQVDANCRLFYAKSGECNGCYDGYKLNGTKCEKDESGVTDPYCAEWKNGKCSKCSFGSYFGSSGLCTLVDPLCQTWNEANGVCKSCYPSFQLNNGKCVVSSNANFDANCAKFTNKGECTQCSRGFYFNDKKVCTQVDPQCANFDSKSARCLGCYSGYKISDGKCAIDVQGVSDLNCAEFKNSVCTKCSQGFFFDEKNRCKAINPQCRYFDEISKVCGDCYPGYVLLNDNCVLGTKNNLCAEWKEGICLRCVVRAYFNDQGGCNQVSQYCNTYNLFDGSCESCYGGFQLSFGKCVAQKQSNGCIQYSKQQICLQCEKRRYLSNGQCLKIDDLCDDFNYRTKQCTRCYSGYTLTDTGCIVTEVGAASEIQNCFTYSLSGSCIECFDRYYLQNNTCNEVNVFCKKYDVTNGDCTDCFTGFKLDGGKCNRANIK